MFTVDVPAGPIAYDDTGGDGPVLVFGHGLLMDGRQSGGFLVGIKCRLDASSDQRFFQGGNGVPLHQSVRSRFK